MMMRIRILHALNLPVKDARPMRKLEMHDPAGAGTLGACQWRGESDLTTLTVRRVALAGAAVGNDVIGHCRPSSQGGLGVDQFGDYRTKPRGKASTPLGSSLHSSLVPDFSNLKSGTGTGDSERPRPPGTGKSGTKVPSPSRRGNLKSGTGTRTGTGTGVSAPWSAHVAHCHYSPLALLLPRPLLPVGTLSESMVSWHTS
jgi:hypothetical protein